MKALTLGHGFEYTIRNFYKAVNEGCDPSAKNVEIVFVSCDNSIEEFKEHIVPMPFPMLPFDSDKIADLEEGLDVESIPIVPLLRKDGTIARESVRQLIQTQGVKCLPDLINAADEMVP